MTADLYIYVASVSHTGESDPQSDQEKRLRAYCARHGIQIRDVVYDFGQDRSFRRPEWQKLLSRLSGQPGATDMLLFTKWDCLSQNEIDVQDMIVTLKMLGVRPQAIDQPLNLEVPESKLVMAVYLAAAKIAGKSAGKEVVRGIKRSAKRKGLGH